VKLVQGSEEIAEAQSILELECFRISVGEDTASKGIGAFSVLYSHEYNTPVSKLGTLSPAEERGKQHICPRVHP